MYFMNLSLRANGCGHQLVVQRGPTSTGLRGEACALERSDAPIRNGAQLGREGVQGLERPLDRGAVGGGLRSQEANPRPPDTEGAQPPPPPPAADPTAPQAE